MRGKTIITNLMLALLLALTAVPAWANDKAQAQVTATTPSAVVTPNGAAVGTIHVIYTVNAFEFPSEPFSFDLDLSLLEVDDKTTYPLTLKLVQKQNGAGNLILTPAAGSSFSFDVAENTWSGGATTVKVAVPAGAPTDDGTTVTGSLQIEAEGPLGKNGNPTNPQLDTNTSIVVKVVLVHPTACLKVVNFVTDNSFLPLSGIVANLQTKKGVTTLNTTNPGQFSDNILVVNSCSDDQVIDLKIDLDSCFDTNPAGNPGQAVFTYLTSGEVDEESFDFSAFGAQTSQGQNLCLAGLTVPAGQTLLATVHMGAVKGIPASALPADGSFDFGAAIFEAGSNGCTEGVLHGMTDSAPVSTTVPFTTK